MAFGAFIRANPALAPLFLFAGGGCAAAVTYPRNANYFQTSLSLTHALNVSILAQNSS